MPHTAGHWIPRRHQPDSVRALGASVIRGSQQEQKNNRGVRGIGENKCKVLLNAFQVIREKKEERMGLGGERKRKQERGERSEAGRKDEEEREGCPRMGRRMRGQREG